jgi:two-component sensor histidine kinase
MTRQSEGWLSISTEGFAAMNAARPAEHLIKELVQNALDSFADSQAGRIELRYGIEPEGFVVECRDNGSGISNLSDLRVVYLPQDRQPPQARPFRPGLQGGALHR